LHVYNHILTFTKLAAHSASVVKSNFGNFGSINPISTSGTAHSLIMHLKSTSDHSFNDYCCTILFILYFVILPCIFFVLTFHCTSYSCISISIVIVFVYYV